MDPAGRGVRTFAIAGSEGILWDRRDDRGRNVPAGVYFVAVDRSIRGRAVVLR